MTTRRRAQLLLIALVVVLHGYAALILWTFHATEPQTATITSCGSGKHYRCVGVVQSGQDPVRVKDANRSDRGRVIAVRTGPLGTYADRGYVELLRLTPAVVIDIGLLLGLMIILPARRLARQQVSAMRAEPGAWLLALADGDVLTDASDRAVITVDAATGAASGPDGVVRFALDRTDPGSGEPFTHVLDPQGGPLGTVQRTHQGTTVRLVLLDADGGQLAVGDATGGLFAITGPGGRPLARLGFDGGRRWLLRIETMCTDPLLSLLLTSALEVHRLTGVRAGRQTSLGLGRGYADN